MESGTGNLKIQAQNFAINNVADTENMITAEPDGFVKLFHNGSEKLATTSTGIDVTGSVVADAATIDGTLTVSSTYPRINLTDTNSNPDWSIINANGILSFYDSTNAVNSLKLSSTGIDVTGTATMDGLVVNGARTNT